MKKKKITQVFERAYFDITKVYIEFLAKYIIINNKGE